MLREAKGEAQASLRVNHKDILRAGKLGVGCMYQREVSICSSRDEHIK